MIATDEASSLLLLQFRDFYSELIKLKRLVRSGAALGASGSPEKTEGDRAANAIAERLTAVMEQQSLIAGRRGSDYTGFYQQAEYAMAVLADEILLHHLDWVGKDAWNNHLMEYRLFRTRIAGEEFFKRL